MITLVTVHDSLPALEDFPLFFYFC